MSTEKSRNKALKKKERPQKGTKGAEKILSAFAAFAG
jgi:hypothetical protein